MTTLPEPAALFLYHPAHASRQPMEQSHSHQGAARRDMTVEHPATPRQATGLTAPIRTVFVLSAGRRTIGAVVSDRKDPNAHAEPGRGSELASLVRPVAVRLIDAAGEGHRGVLDGLIDRCTPRLNLKDPGTAPLDGRHPRPVGR
ncbi:hypothetical protein GCM10022254_17670 [Actinomadura meridiana]|uniref:Uncharacterized protein n=1 Tax=Actinomadura meridiana TaxID=559626 RepID=A0ABP8BW24_9ACTN